MFSYELYLWRTASKWKKALILFDVLAGAAMICFVIFLMTNKPPGTSRDRILGGGHYSSSQATENIRGLEAALKERK